MKAEKIILSLIAVCTGLLVAGIGFYFYQSTKTISQAPPKNITSIKTPTPTPNAKTVLTIFTPIDEEVTDKKTVTVSGNTAKEAIIIISANTNDEVVTPAQNGNFTTTLSIQDGQNILEITAIFPNGQEVVETRTITYSAETF